MPSHKDSYKLNMEIYKLSLSSAELPLVEGNEKTGQKAKKKFMYTENEKQGQAEEKVCATF